MICFISIWAFYYLVHFFVSIDFPKGCVCYEVKNNNIIHFPYLYENKELFVQHQADTYYILLVEVVHSRIFDEALLASIATKVAQAFEDALEAIKQVCVLDILFSSNHNIHKSSRGFFGLQAL